MVVGIPGGGRQQGMDVNTREEKRCKAQEM